MHQVLVAINNGHGLLDIGSIKPAHTGVVRSAHKTHR